MSDDQKDSDESKSQSEEESKSKQETSDSVALADSDSKSVEDTDSKKEEAVSPQPSGPSQPAPEDPHRPRWYVVHTYSGHEAKVAVNLKQRITSQGLDNQILDILVPTQDKIEIHEGRKETVKEKIFPGYILVKMVLNDSTWLAVRSTPGVTSFVGIGDRPTPLPDEEVAMIQKFSQMEAPRYKTSFSVGEAVRINDGPFAEFLGTINEIDEARGKLKVMVSIFGRETPVELDLLQVSKL